MYSLLPIYLGEIITYVVKAHYKGDQLSYFFGVPCLNFNHVIIMKKIHNVFAYYDKSKPKEVKCQKNYIFWFHMMWN